MSNLNLWDRVSKTDPADTKKVSVGRKFTAIDAYAQIKNATAEFGPVGKGWGWEVVEHGVLESAVWLRLRLWYGDPKEQSVGQLESFGGAQFKRKGGEPFDPDEAYKKALTDAITKGLSYLGFNADVFLGKFDDNKYVEDREREVAQAHDRADQDLMAEVKKAVERAKSDQDLKNVRGLYGVRIGDLTRPLQQQIAGWVQEAKTRIEKAEEAKAGAEPEGQPGDEPPWEKEQ